MLRNGDYLLLQHPGCNSMHVPKPGCTATAAAGVTTLTSLNCTQSHLLLRWLAPIENS